MNTILPLAFIVATIFPVHLAIAMPIISLVVAFEYIAICPGEGAIAPFLVVLVLTLVLVAVAGALLPETMAFAQAVGEVAFEVALVLPVVLAVTVGLVVLEVALVDVAVYELLHSLAVLKAI